jgi:hypothetical protein
MLRYKLRTLLIVLALGPILIWAVWLVWLTIATEVTRMVIRGEVRPAYPQDADVPLLSLPTEGEWEDMMRRRQEQTVPDANRSPMPRR